jgi:hypothetical protein
MNYQDGFSVPIWAILCDGKTFSFFRFVGRPLSGHAKPIFSLGQFADGTQVEPIFELAPGINPVEFILRSRRLCESLFYVFLDGYRSGLEAYWVRSLERSRSEHRGRESTPMWQNAKTLAGEAIEEAKAAWIQWQENKVEESRTSAKNALDLLAQRYYAVMFPPVTEGALLVITNYWMSHSVEEAPYTDIRFTDYCTKALALSSAEHEARGLSISIDTSIL